MRECGSGICADVEESICEELGSLQSKMDKIMPIPPGLKIFPTDALKCKICL